MSTTTYRQVNHVILAQTHGRQHLLDVYKRLGYGKYQPKTYSALTQRFRNPKTTVIMFSTGNITNMGCASYYGALRVLLGLKKRLGLDFINVKLTNIVVSLFVGSLGLDHFFESNRGYSTYDPGIFPCCTYNIPGTRIKANIFKSGNVVITGCRSHAQVESSIESVLARVRESVFASKFCH